MATIGVFSSASNPYSTSSLYNTTQTVAAAQSSTTTVAQTAPTQTSAAFQEDSVKLSSAAQAKMLYKQGQSVANIASSLGTDSKTVDNYLGLTLEKEIEKTLASTLSAKA
jgi:DNA-binding NarL/FixJ family response regulator